MFKKVVQEWYSPINVWTVQTLKKAPISNQILFSVMNYAECGIKFILLNLNCASFYLYDAFGSVRVWDEENDLVYWYKYIIITMVHLFWLWVYRLNWIQLRKTHWFDTFIFKSFKWETNCTIQKTCKLHLKNNDFFKKILETRKKIM